MPNEIWKPVYGYEGLYEVSSEGRIRNKKQKYRLPNWNVKSGYGYICLSKNDKRKYFGIHRLVKMTFNPRKDMGKFHAAHLDGNRQNNNLANIIWATPKENSIHKKVHGTEIFGEKNGSAKLSWEKVKIIRDLYSREVMNQDQLAKRFKVGQSRISAICNYKNWKEENTYA